MKRLTISFDNGPLPGATDKILDFLAARSVRATFFVVGERLRDPDARRLAERAKSEGHWIGNHTLTHGEPLGLSGARERVETEIGEAQRLLGDLAHPQKLFRPNGNGTIGRHLLSPEALDYLVANQFTVVTWNNVPCDWDEVSAAGWAERAMDTLETLDWSLLVLHDEYQARMMPILAAFYDRLVDKGIVVVQEFPECCVPLRCGQVTGAIEAIVSRPSVGGA